MMGRVPYAVVLRSSEGDPCAMEAVMRHYSRYIDALAACELVDDDGFARPCIDEGIKREIEARLAEGILRFRAR